MKWILLAILLGGIPILAAWLNQNARYAPWVWGALGASPFLFQVTAPIAWPMWPGYVKGVEITTLDALAAAILLCRGPRRFPLPFKPLIAFYLLATAIAIRQAPVPFAASFYVWQLIRMVLVYAAIARIAALGAGSRAVITGMVLGLAYQAINAMIARAGGALQTGGTLGHQNLLGFMSHMVIMPAFALLLSGRQTRIAAFGVLMGMIAVVLTASRATIGLSAAGFALTFLLSAGMRWSTRKAGMALLAATVLLAGYPLAEASLQRRFDMQRPYEADDSDYDERDAFEKAARMMIADNPAGVGPNSYVTVANTRGYSERAGVIWAHGSRSANVHNSYLLITAETGYLGGLAFIALLSGAIVAALSAAWRWRRYAESEIFVGVAAAALTLSAHALFEWAFVVYQTQYMFAVMLGLMAGLREQMRRRERALQQRRRRAARRAALAPPPLPESAPAQP